VYFTKETNINDIVKFIVYISFIFLLCIGCKATAVQQSYNNHTVEKDETVFSISQQYGISEAAIYKLNPDAKSGVRTGSVLILPRDLINTRTSEKNVTFLTHRVKRKETLFSLSQKYNISQDDIKKYNKDLYSRQLDKGEKIRIPIFSSTNTAGASTGKNTENTLSNTSETGNKHTVKPKETVYGIARLYGISVAELKGLNPGLGDDIKIGTELNVPEKKVTTSAEIDDDEFDFYEVQPREGFFRLKVKLGLTEEEIVALNPYAKDGLKDGMVLKIPKVNAAIAASEEVMQVDLADRIVNRKKKRIAVMLPFQLDKADADTTEATEKLILDNRTLQVALDFYSGVLMATEFAKDKGISIELNVYDTKGDDAATRRILSNNNFENTDAVIGPLLRTNVEVVAEGLKRYDVPVFSPLSNREIKMHSNLFQTLPTDDMLKRALFAYLKKNEANKNFLVIADQDRASQRDEILNILPGAITVKLQKGAYLTVSDIANKLNKTKDNWIILESDNPVLVSNVVALLNGMPASYNLRLFTLDKNAAYDYNDVSNVHLAKLGFTYPSVEKSYNHNDKNAFLISYKNEYGVLPNRYAVRGFDVAYDVILRLAVADDVYKSIDSDYVTEYIENKFRYTKKFLSGYQNEAVYLVKYTKDLQFEEVK